MLEILTPISIVLTVLAIGLFIVSIIIKRNDIADVAWGPGIALTAITAALTSQADLGWPHFLMLGLITIWGLRLGLRIGLKNARKPEDPRYAAWRESWQWFYPRSFLQVYVLQCALMVFLAASAIVAMQHGVSAFDERLVILGAIVWLIGFLFEAVGDYQLDRFLQNPANKGRLMNEGLWRYTRHPNYFGEITMWWGLWVMTLSLPGVWVALISPLTITILIVFVSGLPMLEPLMAKHPDWTEYKRKTSVLIPWWPKA